MANRLNKLFSGNYNDKEINRLMESVKAINELSESMNHLSDDEIKSRSAKLKKKIVALELPERVKDKDGNLILESDESPLDKYLPEAFALVKQATQRLVGTSYTVKGEEQVWHMIPYDVQILGAINLHKGRISEMKTWEGKTLVATMPAYLNALTWRGVHVITVNDYLASRDAEQMSIVYEFLGLEVWCVTKATPPQERRKEYAKDITYIENSELGFDYLRDNLSRSLEERSVLWRPLHYAIVDEIDSILIDEARTPLIISEPDNEPTEKYTYYSQIIKQLTPSKHKKKVSKGFLSEIMNQEDEDDDDDQGDYYIDEKIKTATLSSYGITKLEKILKVENLYQDIGYDEIHHIENALKASSVYTEWKEYLVRNGEVIIVDENTGRAQPWRRFSQGLHQAIEAKEWVDIQRESKTIATITYQNFFKLYYKLSGMTGTATTEWEEFDSIYNLSVLAVPTNKPIIRADINDKVYFNQNAKRKAVADKIEFAHIIGQPLLIGTSSISTSEFISKLLSDRNIKHSVLNAKHHEQEANIISWAWQLGSVVVATNMAGRGTDIKLWKNLNDELALKYAQRIENTVSWNNKQQTKTPLRASIFSEIEFDITLDALQNQFSDLTQDILIESYKSPQQYGDYTIKIDFNKKKKYPHQLYASIGISHVDADDTKLTHRDIHYGLWIIGTEKHESRRIDNQLRGRAGRQGDPWFSIFYVALDDSIMRKMWWEKIQNIASMLLPKSELENIELTQSQFTNAITKSQKQLEWRHFSTRKHLFDYDSVVDKHRQSIYSQREVVLQALNSINNSSDKTQKKEKIDAFTTQIKDLINESVHNFMKNQELLDTEPDDLLELINKEYDLELDAEHVSKSSYRASADHIVAHILEKLNDAREILGDDVFVRVCWNIYLNAIDRNRISHIDDMQYLREKVWLMWYAQLDPLIVYKKESYTKYQVLKSTIENTTVNMLANTNYKGLADNLEQQRQQAAAQQQKASVINKLREAAWANWTISNVDENPSVITIQTGPGKIRPNDKINIKYNDGTIKYNIKYKRVQSDIESWKATILS